MSGANPARPAITLVFDDLKLGLIGDHANNAVTVVHRVDA
jgi:hypothetical protein